MHIKTIKDSNVLQLYRDLLKSESQNDRSKLLDILADKKCQDLISFCNEHDSKINVEELREKLSLNKSDLTTLLVIVSACFIQLFVIDNFTGPTTEKDNKYPSIIKVMSGVSYSSLARDGSEVYHRVMNPGLLWMAQLYLGITNSMALEFLVWKHRCLTIHLMILLEPAETLRNDLRKVQEAIFDHHILNTQPMRFSTVELCCELVQSALLRDDITSSRKILDYASEFSGISIEHTGVLGKRTKFQQKDVPQLVVKVKLDSRANQNIWEVKPVDLPKDVKLDDDTLLPEISFVSAEEDESVSGEDNLSIDSQVLMLTRLDYILKTEVMEESLKDEWTLSYLRSIIKSTRIWSSKYKAMALRSLVERKNMRKMDRSLTQMEELINAIGRDNDLTSERMRSFYSILPLSSWQMLKTLGDLSLDLALFKNGLDIYMKIEYWEGIIKCYCALGQTVKAEKIIRQELEKQETPYLYCLLGDATEDIEHYKKAWTLSNGRFARAQKSIGTHFYTKKEYEVALTHYELAHKASPSNLSILFMLAYSCLTCEHYDKAAEYYRRITNLDDTNFLAWNNLSKAYIKLNQKERAWRTLREAIKCNFEEWKIWENFMVVSIEIGALDDVITAWHRIIDIKSSHEDDQMLRGLTYALVSRTSDKADDEYKKLLGDSIKLTARLTATSKCSPRLWICYFKLLVKEIEVLKLNPEGGDAARKPDLNQRISKITNALQRATPNSGAREPEKINQMLDCYDELADCYRYVFELLGPGPELWRQWKSFKLSALNALKTLEKIGYYKED